MDSFSQLLVQTRASIEHSEAHVEAELPLYRALDQTYRILDRIQAEPGLMREFLPDPGRAGRRSTKPCHEIVRRLWTNTPREGVSRYSSALALAQYDQVPVDRFLTWIAERGVKNAVRDWQNLKG